MYTDWTNTRGTPLSLILLLCLAGMLQDGVMREIARFAIRHGVGWS